MHRKEMKSYGFRNIKKKCLLAHNTCTLQNPYIQRIIKLKYRPFLVAKIDSFLTLFSVMMRKIGHE